MPDYGNFYPWAPNGYVDVQDESQQNYYTRHGPQVVACAYAQNYPFDGRQRGDESYQQNSYGYIPTELEIASAVAIRNMSALNGEYPRQGNDPTQNQIIQTLYANTASLWQDVARYNGTWGVENE